MDLYRNNNSYYSTYSLFKWSIFCSEPSKTCYGEK